MRATKTWLFLLMLLAGCSIPHTQDDIAKTPEAIFLQDVADKLAAHDYSALKALLDPSVVQPDIDKALNETAAALPLSRPSSITFITWRFSNTITPQGTTRIANISAEYAYPENKWILISANLKGEPGAFRILSFNVNPLPRPLAEINAFTFVGKGPLHFAFLVLAIGAAALSVWTFVLAVRTRNLQWKWLWALFCLIGFCRFSLNWTTGDINIIPLYFNLLSAGVSSAGFGTPWIISWSVPIGALAFLIKRWRMIRYQSV